MCRLPGELCCPGSLLPVILVLVASSSGAELSGDADGKTGVRCRVGVLCSDIVSLVCPEVNELWIMAYRCCFFFWGRPYEAILSCTPFRVSPNVQTALHAFSICSTSILESYNSVIFILLEFEHVCDSFTEESR